MKVCPKCGNKVTWFGMIVGITYYYCVSCEKVIEKINVKEKEE